MINILFRFCKKVRGPMFAYAIIKFPPQKQNWLSFDGGGNGVCPSIHSDDKSKHPIGV